MGDNKMDKLNNIISEYLVNLGMSQHKADLWNGIILLLLLVALAILFDWLLRISFVPLFKRFVGKTKNKLDDLIVHYKLHSYIIHIIPAYILYRILPIVFKNDAEIWVIVVKKSCLILITLFAALSFSALMNVFNGVMASIPKYRNKPLSGTTQIFKIIGYLCAVLIIISILIDQKLGAIFAGLAAAMTILMLIFRDTILGLVAGIQLSGNNMLMVGDWIEVPKYGADGAVIEVTINTVKVQNWDKTITMIPAYALVSESFHNWRGMSESGGRRVKRSINIDMRSIHFCTPDELEKLKEVRYMRRYIEETEKDIRADNEQEDKDVRYGLRAQTNVGVFRNYLIQYLKHHPHVHKEMTCMVRLLQPTERGMPMELYFFTNTVIWAEYERIQSDVFDHVLAIMPMFGLKVFQNLSGSDLVHEKIIIKH